jgi:hypothetical protein
MAKAIKLLMTIVFVDVFSLGRVSTDRAPAKGTSLLGDAFLSFVLFKGIYLLSDIRGS